MCLILYSSAFCTVIYLWDGWVSSLLPSINWKKSNAWNEEGVTTNTSCFFCSLDRCDIPLGLVSPTQAECWRKTHVRGTSMTVKGIKIFVLVITRTISCVINFLHIKIEKENLKWIQHSLGNDFLICHPLYLDIFPASKLAPFSPWGHPVCKPVHWHNW